MNRRKHPKPGRSPYAFVFSPQGKVWVDKETFPDEQKQQELVIAQKFAKSLPRFNIDLGPLVPVEDEGDISTEAADGTKIRMQLAEVTFTKWRAFIDQEKAYRNALRSNPEINGLFSGCNVDLTIYSKEYVLPNPKSKRGRRLLDELTRTAKQIGKSVHTLAVGKQRVRKAKIVGSNVELLVICDRLTSGEGTVSNWVEGLPMMPPTPSALADQIQSKINKQYSKPDEKFWLVLYSPDLIPQSEDIAFAINFLEENKHPFDRVWFIHPYPNQDSGHVVDIWPKLF